jgi:hypothetical protein
MLQAERKDTGGEELALVTLKDELSKTRLKSA